MAEKREETDDSKNRNYVSCFASLRIEGTASNCIDFQEVEEHLGIKPTYVVHHGETRLPGNKLALVDVWIYDVEVEKDQPLDNHLAALKTLLDPYASYLRSIAARWMVSIYCGYITDLAQGHIVIPWHLAGMFSDYGVDLEISIQSWGGIITEAQDDEDHRASD